MTQSTQWLITAQLDRGESLSEWVEWHDREPKTLSSHVRSIHPRSQLVSARPLAFLESDVYLGNPLEGK